MFEIAVLSLGLGETDPVTLTSDLIICLTGVFQFLAYLIGGIIFLIWTYKACFNARQLAAEKMKHSPGWSVGWYFVPIFSLWKPYQAMKEIWDVSHKAAGKINASATFLGVWWALWIISNIFSQIGFRLSMQSNSQELIIVSNVIFLLSDLIVIPLNLIVINIINTIYKMQIIASKENRDIISY